MADIRDKKGRLVPGHPYLRCKPGNKNGRPKSLASQVRDALSVAEDAMPTIIAAMIRRANGEEECPAAVRQAAAEYLCDRIYGRPNQPLSGTGQFMLRVKDWTDKHE